MDQRPVGPVYLEGHPSLRGRVLFTNAEPGQPDAAFIERNDGPAADIESLIRQGYLIRARTDSDTRQARTNDTTTRDAMIKSGAQMLSTDYPAASPRAGPDTTPLHCPVTPSLSAIPSTAPRSAQASRFNNRSGLLAHKGASVTYSSLDCCAAPKK